MLRSSAAQREGLEVVFFSEGCVSLWCEQSAFSPGQLVKSSLTLLKNVVLMTIVRLMHRYTIVHWMFAIGYYYFIYTYSVSVADVTSLIFRSLYDRLWPDRQVFSGVPSFCSLLWPTWLMLPVTPDFLFLWQRPHSDLVLPSLRSHRRTERQSRAEQKYFDWLN